MSKKDGWDEYRLLILELIERHDNAIESLEKSVSDLQDKVRDQRWQMIIMAIIGGISGGGGVDIVKFFIGLL